MMTRWRPQHIALGTAAGDAYAKWVIDTSTNVTDFSSNIAKMLGFLAKSSAATPGPANPVIFVIIAGFLALLFSCFQIVLMVVRGGMLVVLAGVSPLTAAFTNTETGRAWFRKTCGWILAFILYKPAAAIIYATSFRLVGDAQLGSGGGITTALTGITLMLLALVALPALMRFVLPMVSAIGGGSGGGGPMLGPTAMALPSGAISAGGRGASGSAGSGSRSASARGQGSTSGGGAGLLVAESRRRVPRCPVPGHGPVVQPPVDRQLAQEQLVLVLVLVRRRRARRVARSGSR